MLFQRKTTNLKIIIIIIKVKATGNLHEFDSVIGVISVLYAYMNKAFESLL